jgi:hypothetical protein
MDQEQVKQAIEATMAKIREIEASRSGWREGLVANLDRIIAEFEAGDISEGLTMLVIFRDYIAAGRGDD